MESLKALNWMNTHYWVVIVCFVLIVIVECTLICVRSVSRAVPYNYILLLIFTLCEAYLVAFICSRTNPQTVLAAFFMTAAMTITLTIYAMVTKTDIRILYGLICVISSTLFMLFIFSIFVRFPYLNMIYCSLCVILFGIYLVMDTQLIL